MSNTDILRLIPSFIRTKDSYKRCRYSFVRFNMNICQIMDGHGRIFILLQVFLCFFVLASTVKNKHDCSQVQCPGPLTYYEDVGCTPVYKNKGDCCAYKYNCDHLDARSPNKCYIKNRSYEIDESYGYDENNPCSLGCYCSKGVTSGRFDCAMVRCFIPFVGEGCYLERNVSRCCPGPVNCPKNGSKIPECVVDGVTYKGGEIFTPENEPRKRCSCREGYTGENIEPFCIRTSTRCSTDLYHNEDIANKCAPIFYSDQNPATSCSSSWRCQNANDTVIPNPNGPTPCKKNSSGGKHLTCKFGNLTMNLGDELSQNTGIDSECLRCVCEVPPTPTCKYLNDDDCISAMSLLGRK